MSIQTDNLVKGYMARRISNDGQQGFQERLFAVAADGSIRATGWIEPSNSFNARGRVWDSIDALPEDAKFIGNYETPTGR